MPTILIKCPKTGLSLSTQMGVDSQKDFDSSTFAGNSVNCPHCGQVHVWSKKDAWVEGN